MAALRSFSTFAMHASSAGQRTPATTETIGGLTPGAHYTFRVAARNARGVGAQSASSSAVVRKVSRPNLVALTAAAAQQPFATLSW